MSLFAVALSLLGCHDVPPTFAPEEPEVPKAPRPPTTREPPPARVRESPEVDLKLSGTIAYTGPAKGKAVFVSVRDPNHPGPPLAAQKLPPGPFPLDFTLTEADMMQMGEARPVPREVTLTARLDADGDAMTKEPSEPSATLQTSADATNLAITLSAPK